MTETRQDQTQTPDAPRFDALRRPSFITPEMITKNPALEAAGLFAGDPLWLELREEIRRNRERDREAEEQAGK